MSQIRLIKPDIAFDEVEEEFRDIFATGIFTRGTNVEAFRREVAEFTGAAHAFLATSATTALWLGLKALGVGRGDQVIVSDFSFPASANVIEDLGAAPVFADVDPATYNMRPEVLDALIGPRTRAVMFVDALGNPTGLGRIKEICDAHGVPLIEDAACAIGSSEAGRRCGSIADVTCFSFHPRKLVCTGEGGAITTDRDDLAEWLAVKLAHGAQGSKGLVLDFVDYGYNFRLPELAAVMGRKQLAKLDAIVADRNAIRDRYIEALDPLGFVPQAVGDDVTYNVQSLVFTVPDGVDRDELILRLRGRVETTIGTYALSSTTYFAGKYDNPQPVAAQLEASTITFPCFSGVDVDAVVDAVRDAVGRDAHG